MPTAIGMPAQYEMLVSHSPPVFSHSPPTAYHSSQSSTNFNSSAASRLYDPSRNVFRQPQQQQPMLTALHTKRTAYQPLKLKMPTSPIRPCLVVKPDSIDITDSSSTPTANAASMPSTDSLNNGHIKMKKRVVFADDQGHSLTEIRIMSEPSNVPPLWSLEFLAHVTQGMISPVPAEQWTVAFRQPASDYLDFRRKLDGQNVSLENVIVKETESIVVGTVKVRNLSFTKEVIVRTSWDDWVTQEDTICTYATIGGASGAYVLYDTFSFKLTLPPVSGKLEFCVCYRSDGIEYWDNNENKNYQIYKRTNNATTTASGESNAKCKTENAPIPSTPIAIQNKYADLTHAKVASWSEFASWDHLENTSPYW